MSAADAPRPPVILTGAPRSDRSGGASFTITAVLRMLRAQRWRLAGSALLAAAATLCAIGLLATSGWLISRASQMPPVLSLSVAIVCVRAFGIGRGVFRYAERLVSHDATFRALTVMRLAVYDRLERLAPGGLAAFRRGDLLGRLVADVDAMQDLPLRALLPGAAAVIAGATSVAVTWWLLPAAGVVLLVALLVGGLLVPWLAVATGRHAERVAADARGDLSAQVLDLLRGATDLVAAGAAASALDRARSADTTLTASSRTSAAALGLSSAAGVLTSGVAVLGALVAAIPAVRDGRLDGVALAVVVLLPLAAYEAVTGLPAAALALVGVRASSARLDAVVSTPDPVRDPSDPTALPAAVADARGLRVRDLRARWTTDGPEVLHGVDLDVAPGRRVAVVGTSGAGKSTLVSVLLRFLEYDGSATLDGVELRDLAGDDVRAAIGLCAQDAHVFDTSVEENLRLARTDATDDDLRAVLDRVRLLAWADALPQGLATPVGEHGSRMSGGQRQRLALARCLLADRSVLVLDEPTEHLDLATADALTADLLDLTTGLTTVLVTHRLTGLERVDEIVVLDGGRVVERGTHDELVANEGAYAELYAREQDRLAIHRSE